MNILNERKYFWWKWLISTLCILFIAGCKVPYDQPVKSSNSHYLVVEGYLNANGKTNIKLSRTRNISWGDTAGYINEINAKVIIEDNQNNVYPLNETGDGNYTGDYFLTSYNNYRLQIITSDQREYLSDFISPKISPTIQNVGWIFKDGGVQIYLDTEDPNNKTRYYRWSYIETSEFHSQYFSNIKYNKADTSVIGRTQPVFVCYRERNASTILLGSSAKLSEDVIHEAPILYIPNHDRRISVLYSIFVTQYALDSSAYNYWNAMKSNTENVGSIFDPQPNQTMGNIHSVSDSTEKVIGYIGAGTTDSKRIFISNSEMPADWNQMPNCTEYEVPNNIDSFLLYFAGNSFIPYLKDSTPSGAVKGYFSASGTCVDCTLTGTLVKPPFWP
jgi:hypothetical protein